MWNAILAFFPSNYLKLELVIISNASKHQHNSLIAYINFANGNSRETMWVCPFLQVYMFLMITRCKKCFLKPFMSLFRIFFFANHMSDFKIK